jgi:hypothetical protein
MAIQYPIGTIVRILPAYRMPCGSEPARFVADGTEGVYVVVGSSRDDALLCRAADVDVLVAMVKNGEVTASDYDIACHPDRITTDITRTER